MITKKITMFAVMMAAAVIVAAPTVTDVTAKQRYPWNGLVDITCKVTGIAGTTNGLEFSVAAVPETGNVLKGSQFWVMQNGVKMTDSEVRTNGNYRLLWDARETLGNVIYSNMVVRVTLRSHGKVQLWEGGPYWADTNIGGDEPWESGYYFWWGDTIGYKLENGVWVASDGSSSPLGIPISVSTSTFQKSIATLKSECWITADGILVPEHDAAHVHWGGNWRMPTDLEFRDLDSKCDWTWTTLNGVNGYVVCGRGAYASNSIFLPAAEYSGSHAIGSPSSTSGYYWSSVPVSENYDYYSWGLYFSSNGYHSIGTGGKRFNSMPIRPVQGFTE